MLKGYPQPDQISFQGIARASDVLFIHVPHDIISGKFRYAFVSF
jgi:hypothetical protein